MKDKIKRKVDENTYLVWYDTDHLYEIVREGELWKIKVVHTREK